MKCALLALLIPILGACSTQQAQQSRQQPTQKLAVTRKQNRAAMTETITASTPDGAISATARLRRYDPRKDAQPSRHWLGVDGGTPDVVLADLSFVVAGHRVSIPSALYADFGDFDFHSQFLELASGSDRLFLNYSGGDGAGSFDADFVVRGTQLEEVRIHALTLLPNNLIGKGETVRNVP